MYGMGSGSVYGYVCGFTVCVRCMCIGSVYACVHGCVCLVLACMCMCVWVDYMLNVCVVAVCPCMWVGLLDVCRMFSVSVSVYVCGFNVCVMYG